MKFISDIRLLLTGIWLGAAVFFVAVAQSAFRVLPAESEGNLVSATLMILNISGFVIGLLLFLTSLIKGQGLNPAQIWVERVLTVLLAVACGVGEFVFGLWLVSIKARLGGPIDSLPSDHADKILFDDLHDYSVWVLYVGMAACLLLFFIISGKNFGSSSATKIKM